MSKALPLDKNYTAWLLDLKSRIRQSQIKASVRVNSALLELYWSIGADIVAKKAESVWGSGVLRRISQDLREEFSDSQGFSVTNLKYMKMFFVFYSKRMDLLHQSGVKLADRSKLRTLQIGHQTDDQTANPSEMNDQSSDFSHQVGDHIAFPVLLGLVPWRHHVEIFSRCKSIEEALFYVHATIQNGWSRAMLQNFMDTGLYARQGKAIDNFSKLLPHPQGDLAHEILKDPYNFDFITLTQDYREKELEDALTSNITKFLLELGQGFAYVGRQIPLIVGEKEFFIDLLFYHLELRCYIVIELKAGEFQPEDAGQLAFYVTAVNHLKKKDSDNQTVGMIICRTKDNIVAQYSLESSTQPIGISEYELSRLLPENYKSALPSIEEIESSLKTRILEELTS
ncbi:MAG: PDDEXK nuclease domain-containing protein [Synergistaceae bacterium]|jgi:predicted nuclease of restriction endonuclease-like (RecB) superfamily|nr:PDDEXK nuclease domain-containing protein [Synergistaceae bacterium]